MVTKDVVAVVFYATSLLCIFYNCLAGDINERWELFHRMRENTTVHKKAATVIYIPRRVTSLLRSQNNAPQQKKSP